MSESRNPVLALTWAIPLVAVLASFGTLALAVLKPDRELPEQYHWEGLQLDRDFALARRAADRNVRAVLRVDPGSASCRLALRIEGSAPRALVLVLTHATKPALDRTLTFARTADGTNEAMYQATCSAPPAAHWRVELKDSAGEWSLRQYVSGPPGGWHLAARTN